MPTSPQYVRNQIHKRTDNYIESIGRQDIQTLSEVFDAPDGKGTVIRLIFGASPKIPLRALSYIDSAARVAEFLPNEQLQIIFANSLGNRVNGHSEEVLHEQAIRCAALGKMLITSFHPTLRDRTLFAEDTPSDLIDKIEPVAGRVLESDTKDMRTLRERGQTHAGDHRTYTAAHLVYQDTRALELRPLFIREPAPVTPDRIVSIGSQKEREFYAARMAIRQQLEGVELLPTAQLFTRHVTPPYFTARGGEQSIDDALMNGVDMQHCTDLGSLRDLTHFMNLIGIKKENI